VSRSLGCRGPTVQYQLTSFGDKDQKTVDGRLPTLGYQLEGTLHYRGESIASLRMAAILSFDLQEAANTHSYPLAMLLDNRSRSAQYTVLGIVFFSLKSTVFFLSKISTVTSTISSLSVHVNQGPVGQSPLDDIVGGTPTTETRHGDGSTSEAAKEHFEDDEDGDEDYSELPNSIGYRELFSLLTADRKFIPIFTGGAAIYNPTSSPTRLTMISGSLLHSTSRVKKKSPIQSN
jgi:hypothetical protein